MPLTLAFIWVSTVSSSATCKGIDGFSGVLMVPINRWKTELAKVSVSLKGQRSHSMETEKNTTSGLYLLICTIIPSLGLITVVVYNVISL